MQIYKKEVLNGGAVRGASTSSFKERASNIRISNSGFNSIRGPMKAAAVSEHTVVRGLNKGRVVSKEVIQHRGSNLNLNLLQGSDGGEHYSDPPIMEGDPSLLKDKGGGEAIILVEGIPPRDGQALVLCEVIFGVLLLILSIYFGFYFFT